MLLIGVRYLVDSEAQVGIGPLDHGNSCRYRTCGSRGLLVFDFSAPRFFRAVNRLGFSMFFTSVYRRRRYSRKIGIRFI